MQLRLWRGHGLGHGWAILVLSGVCLLVAWHLRRAEHLWFIDSDLYQRHGKRLQRLTWPGGDGGDGADGAGGGELRLLPMGGLHALILRDADSKEFPLCTWRSRAVCLTLAQQLNAQAPHSLPITALDGDEHEFARLRGQQAQIQPANSQPAPSNGKINRTDEGTDNA